MTVDLDAAKLAEPVRTAENTALVLIDVCVHTTVREATDRGFFCHYVRDAISTFDPALRVACERMIDVEGGIWGRLTDVHEALGELEVLQ